MEKETARGMWIPTIGDEVTLATPWKFALYHEHRNTDMVNFIFPEAKGSWHTLILPNGAKPEYGKKICDIELPTGAVLKVDRIYIRKGGADMKNYDSVTFILQSIPKKEIAIPTERASYAGGRYSRKMFTKKKARFWAKLRDVNQMRFYMGREKIETEEEPTAFSGRLIRLGEGWEE